MDSPMPPMTNARESFHCTSSTENTSLFKDASLSSSLKAKSQENGNGIISDDTEISIFGAHKYFSESNDPDLMSVPRLLPVDGYCRNFWTKSFRSTPTPSSEISCNSQTGLLPNPQHTGPVPTKNFPLDCINKRWYAAKKWLLRRKCCCHGEKSVQVKESTLDLEHKKPVLLINASNTISVCQEREQSFPETVSGKCSITHNIVEIHHVKAKASGPLSLSEMDFSSMDAPLQQRITAPGRSFIDGAVGFTFPILNPSDDNLSKKVTNPLEDCILEGFHKQGSSVLESKQDSIPREDDVGSDASSDLFEIESLSTHTTPCPCPVCRRRTSVDHDHGEDNIEVNVAAAEVGSGDAASLRPPEMGGEGKMQRKESLMSCTYGKEKAVSMKCMADGPPLSPLHVGGRPPPLSYGSSDSAGRLSLAFAACEVGVSQARWW